MFTAIQLVKPPRGATNLPRRRAEFVLQTTILLRYCQYRSEESAALLDRRVVTTAVFDGGAEHDARDAADVSCAAPQGAGRRGPLRGDDPSALRLAGRSRPRDLDGWKSHGEYDGFAQRLP